jgi:hypothetical protein
MKTEIRRYFTFFTAAMLVAWIISCSGRSGTSALPTEKKDEVKAAVENSPKLINLLSPGENAELKLNGGFTVSINPVKNNSLPDSVRIFFDGRAASTLTKPPWDYKVPSSFTSKTGRKALKVVAYRGGAASQTITRFLIVYSDLQPKRNSF